jgi:hypothetical protein
MTPEERNLVQDLFDRLAALENAEREPEAERAIGEGLKRAPHAVYALVQTALVQDEALKRADARIHDLEAQLGNQAEPPRAGGFLGSMREALTGRRGSVPTVRPGDAPMGAPPDYRGPPPPPMAAGPAFGGRGGGGGSFLGTAAAAAAGAIGGSLMLESIRNMMGHRQGIGGSGSMPGSALAGEPGSPWAAAPSGGGNLAREAGIDDIGRRDDAGRSHGQASNESKQQLADDDETQQAADADYQDDDDYHDDGDFDSDSGDFDAGGDDE